MTVAELIAELSAYPGDLKVGFSDNEYGWTEVDAVFDHEHYRWVRAESDAFARIPEPVVLIS